MIIFGWYSFKIKSFTQQELNIYSENIEQFTIEVRQKVIHIFWLPIIPIGKDYVIRKNGKLYKIPIATQNLINKNKVKTPWYSFLAPIATIAFLIISPIINSIAEKENQKRKVEYEKIIQQNFEKKQITLIKQLNTLTPNHYIKLETSKISNNTIYLKVQQVKDSIIYCSIIEVNKWQKNYYNPKMIFNNNKAFLDTIPYSINTLKKSILTDYKQFKLQQYDYSKTNPNNSVDLIQDGLLYNITSIDYINGPLLKVLNNYNVSKHVRKLCIENIGDPADLIAIKNLGSPVDWDFSGPSKLGFYKKQCITGKDIITDKPRNFKFLLIFLGENKEEFQFIISNYNKVVRKEITP